ncbi:phytoene desaturase family protein [Bradyrhizobium tropiciagri]|uniref:phytoene desaturase family protein n=1 Tax=Bradyrhizobium tropiciagri TaxID=312253 RepID=UPI00067A963E|nr:FAD-dependent oxidoreductase [Bradyrhizobium tropiciagri]
MKDQRVDIVGGGLAGLIAAVELARKGTRVAVFETANEFGGRARTRDLDGFLFNRGPHALYCNGALKRTLDRLGIAYTGGRNLSRARQAIIKGRLHSLPTTLGSIVTTSLLGLGDKVSFTRAFKAIMDGATRAGSFADWLDGEELSPMVRSLVEALARLSSYANGSGHISARVLLDQIRITAGGTIYVDGGWASLVKGLVEAARAAGVELNLNAAVDRVTRTTDGLQLVLGNGESRSSEAVILAVAPHEAATLAGDITSLIDEVRESRAVRANTLDLALRGLPPGAHDFALGIDEPFYLSVHTGSAKLAPVDGAIVHIAKYLPIGEAPAKNATEELEAIADLVMPGWREREVTRQTLRGMVVSHSLPRWDRPRASVCVPGAFGLFVAGDWVGEEGMIADAAAASGVQAAQSAFEWLSRGRTPGRAHS